MCRVRSQSPTLPLLLLTLYLYLHHVVSGILADVCELLYKVDVYNICIRVLASAGVRDRVNVRREFLSGRYHPAHALRFAREG
jgi:hypothetical protein